MPASSGESKHPKNLLMSLTVLCAVFGSSPHELKYHGLEQGNIKNGAKLVVWEIGAMHHWIKLQNPRADEHWIVGRHFSKTLLQHLDCC